MSITARERNALGKIIDFRFKALQDELLNRRQKVARAISDRIREETKTSCERAAKRMDKHVQKARALEIAIRKDLDILSHQGLVPGAISNGGRTYALTAFADNVAFTLASFMPPDVDARIRKELDSLTDERVMAGRSLDAIRMDLHERLLLGEVESGGARSFLNEIPTVETLLPLPADIAKQIPTAV